MVTPSSFYKRYLSIFTKNLSDTESIKEALSKSTHQMWHDLSALFNDSTNDEIQFVLDQAHSNRFAYSLPDGVHRRMLPKAVQRVREKLQFPPNRSTFADWIACRYEAPFATFASLRASMEQSLPSHAALVWRYDYEKEPDIVQYGYAYIPGHIAVMEIQLVEPFVSWVFASNSKNKHQGATSFVTFEESKEWYLAIKSSVLSGKPVTHPALENIAQFYKTGRAKRGDDPNELDENELAKLQEILDNSFKETF